MYQKGNPYVGTYAGKVAHIKGYVAEWWHTSREMCQNGEP